MKRENRPTSSTLRVVRVCPQPDLPHLHAGQGCMSAGAVLAEDHRPPWSSGTHAYASRLRRKTAAGIMDVDFGGRSLLSLGLRGCMAAQLEQNKLPAHLWNAPSLRRSGLLGVFSRRITSQTCRTSWNSLPCVAVQHLTA